MAKFMIIGPITKDKIVKKDFAYESIGGAVYYQSAVFSGLGIDNTVLTTLARKDNSLLDDLPRTTKVIPLYTDETMEFENIYPDDNLNHRIQKAFLPQNPINPSHLEEIDLEIYDAILLSPLSPYDLPLDTVEYIARRGVPIYMGAQGYLRQIKSKDLFLGPWPNYKSFLKCVKLLFLDEMEARKILGESDKSYTYMVRILSTYGPEEVIMTCGNRGSLIYSEIGHKIYQLPVHPPQSIVDPTGLGDTFMAAYAVKKLETDDPEECGKFASLISSIKMGYKGAFRKN
jgi:sugar/nucleoside kinase (ribokinase family)